MQKQPPRPFRIVLLSIFTLSLFAFIILQFFRLQIIEGDKWVRIAKSQHEIIVPEPARRGVFIANTAIAPGGKREGAPLVIDVPKFHLYIDPVSIPVEKRKECIEILSKILHLSKERKERMVQQFSKKSRLRRIATWLEIGEKREIDLWWKPFSKENKIPRNALYFEKEYHRSYPYGHLLGQVLHALSEERDPLTGKLIPTGGLEKRFSHLIQGKDGAKMLLRSPRHPLDIGTIIAEPQHGINVELSINHVIQSICEDELAKGVRQAQAKGGWAVVMDPKTGEIIAIAHYPFFEPARYKEYFNDPNGLVISKPRAVTDPVEPGSVIKPISMAIALMANEELKKKGKSPLFYPDEFIRVDDGTVPGRNKPLKDVAPYRYLTMDMALQKSSNIYLGKLVHKIISTYGPEWYTSRLHEVFGFGEKTGIEIPGETPGSLPKPGKIHKSGKLEWSSATPYSLAFGYNLQCNAIQLLKAYAVLANGGYKVSPTIIKKPVYPRKKVLSSAICDRITQALKYSTKIGGGGIRGAVARFSEAGKSGTTEKLKGNAYSKEFHFSSFIGFAPAKNAKLLIYVGIDEPEHKFIPGIGKMYFGGRCAAPIFSSIMEKSLEYLGVSPDDPLNIDWVIESQKLKEKLMKANYDKTWKP